MPNKEKPPHYEVLDTVPRTQLEPVTPAASSNRFRWLALGIGFFATCTASFMVWHFLNEDSAFNAETTVNKRLRAELAQNAVREEDVEPDEPEVIDFGGNRAIAAELNAAGDALTSLLTELNQDVNCEYFNLYRDLVRDAVEQGINPLFALRKEVNALTWKLKQLATTSDQGAKADIATTTADRFTALLFVISVVTGDRTSETPFFCAMETGNAAIAAEIYLQRLEQVLERKRGDLAL